MRKLVVLAALAACLALPANAAAKWVIPGKGFGHGVGMPQYGAMGMAKDGKKYRGILRHYYTGVKVGEAGDANLRVLITTGLMSLPFRGATSACGKSLNPAKSYSFKLVGGKVTLRRPNGSKLSSCGGEGRAKGGKSVVFNGVAEYRGQLRARVVGGSIYAINAVGIDGYIKGVIPNEVPASWPTHALRAQAVAARSYALTTRIGGNGYDLYDDQRSQVYGGKSSEQPATTRAASKTAGKVIKSGGQVAQAFFYSSSGGRTENSEFGFPGGGTPRAYLKSVRDPKDKVSPYHRWKVRYSNSEMSSRLSGLYSGKLKRVRILKTGVSPRVVRARVVGSGSSSVVNGDTLRFRLGLRSNWFKAKKR